MKVIKTLKYGDSFGELALINDSPRSATVTALNKSELIHEITIKLFKIIIS